MWYCAVVILPAPGRNCGYLRLHHLTTLVSMINLRAKAASYQPGTQMTRMLRYTGLLKSIERYRHLLAILLDDRRGSI